MGICIHYKGKLKHKDLLDQICQELVSIVDIMGWTCQ